MTWKKKNSVMTVRVILRISTQNSITKLNAFQDIEVHTPKWAQEHSKIAPNRGGNDVKKCSVYWLSE